MTNTSDTNCLGETFCYVFIKKIILLRIAISYIQKIKEDFHG